MHSDCIVYKFEHYEHAYIVFVRKRKWNKLDFYVLTRFKNELRNQVPTYYNIQSQYYNNNNNNDNIIIHYTLYIHHENGVRP